MLKKDFPNVNVVILGGHEAPLVSWNGFPPSTQPSHMATTILASRQADSGLCTVQFAKEIAEAKIPLIFTATRPGPDSWTKKDSPPGPPLSRSPADILSEAGVLYAVAINTDGGKSYISFLFLAALTHQLWHIH